MRTAPIQEHIIQQLKEQYTELERFKRKIDPDSNIRPELFLQIAHQIKAISHTKIAAQDQLQHIVEQLKKLQDYLSQFEAFRRMSLTFFEETKSVSKIIRQTSIPYIAAKEYFRQIFENFKKGDYLQTGLYASIQLMEQYIEQFYQQTAEKINDAPFSQITLSSPSQNRISDLPALKQYIATNTSLTPDIASARMIEITKGFFTLKRKELYLATTGKEYKLSKRLELLKHTLIKGDTEQIITALRTLSNMVHVTQLLSPINHSTTPKKLIAVTGTTEPATKVTILLNKKTSMETLADKKGAFIFEEVELEFGDNTIEYQNNELFFLAQQKGILHLKLETSYPFLGLHDPMTQKAFQPSEAAIIIRCQTCQNFMYDFAMEENNGECAIPKCDGREFVNIDDTEFWV